MSAALIIDDHPITHVGCRRLLVDLGYDPVLGALTSARALELASAHRPGFLVLDLGLPDIGGLQLIPLLLECSPGARILVFSMNEGPVFAARALEAGAKGYISKSSSPELFRAAVQVIEDGRVFLDHELATELAMLNVGIKDDPLASLGPREHQVLSLVGKGKSHAEIADAVHVSYKTVANICSLLKRKLGAKSHADLIRLAIERGLQ